MKRILSIFLAAVMLLGVMPWQAFAEDKLPIEVTFVKKDKSEVKVNFTNETEKLGLNGTPGQTGAWIFKSYFIGWSDNKDYIKDGKGFLLYDTASVSDLLEKTNEKNIKLYSIYASTNLSTQIAKGNTVRINEGVLPKEFMDLNREDMEDGTPEKTPGEQGEDITIVN